MTIHKEGRTLLFILLIVFVGINAFLSYQLPEAEVVRQGVIILSIILYLLVLQFFRNPNVNISADANEVLAPAEGKVVVIEEAVETEYFNDKRIQISIFMSPLNVHLCRTPVAGLVKFFKYHAGKYLVAWHPKSSTENERTTMVVEHKSGAQILVRQIAGAVARRIKWYVDAGHELTHGAEYGFIKFGSRLDVFLPLDADIQVKIGDKTKGAQTVIAKLK